MVGQLWGSGRGTRVPLQGAIVMCYGAGRRWWANFGGVDVDVGVPLQGAIVMYYGGGGPTLAEWTWHQGAIAGCHCWLPLPGAIAGCHCSVLWWGETMVGQLWGSGRGRGTRLPLQGAIAGCHCSVLWWGETLAVKKSVA